MRDLSEFDLYLSEEGQQFLARWSIKLVGLYHGSMAPKGANEKHFVDVFNKGEEPQGKSEIFWFNIIAINQLIEKCASLEAAIENELAVKKGLVGRINNLEREITMRVHPLEEEVKKLKNTLQGCWAKIDKYEKELGVENPASGSKPGDTCPICKGTGGMGNCSRCDGKGYL
ncbi:MAG: zinc finger-like domain-containing protein [Gammaproteobacteria bacterium]|nr:zinc finger-like domain-containing protein [Gammaproteobacteria bacterium]